MTRPVSDVSIQKGKHTLARMHIQAFGMASSDMLNPAATNRSTQCGGDEADHDHQVTTHPLAQRPPHAKSFHTIRRHTKEKYRHF